MANDLHKKHRSARTTDKIRSQLVHSSSKKEAFRNRPHDVL